MDPMSLVSAGVGLIGGIGSIFGAHSANKKLDQLLANDPRYNANPLAAQRLGLTKTLLNARAPGAAFQEANIYGNQANTNATVERNATSGTQALAVGAATQAQTNQAFAGMSEQDAADYQRRFGNYVGAEEGQIQEGDKEYQDRIRRFEDEGQIRGAQNANTQNAWKSLSNLGFAGLNFGMNGGFGKPKPATA